METGRGLALPLAEGARGHDGQTVLYGVRPEHWSLAGDGIPAKVSVVEPTGSETLVFAEVDGAPVCAAFQDRHRFAAGETVMLKPKLEAVHLFDRASGQALS